MHSTPDSKPDGKMNDILLTVENLSVRIVTRRQTVEPISDISFNLSIGEKLGLVGESGAGKSMIGQALLGLLQPPVSLAAGKINFHNQQLDQLGEKAWRQLRGKNISLIAQDSLTALNPLFSIGAQIVETILTHQRISIGDAKAMAITLLQRVGLPKAGQRFKQFPHQLSGGMRQRVVIALAIANKPDLIIADEPTTALDVSVQAQILNLLDALILDGHNALILISHDMAVISRMTDRVAVLYAGRIVEIGPTTEVISAPQHPYTQGLMRAIPKVGGNEELTSIPGAMPSPGLRPSGCAFHPRCPQAFDRCRLERPPLLPKAEDTHQTACWLNRATS